MNFSLKSDPMGQSYALTLNQIAPGFIIIPGVVGNTLAMGTILGSKMLRQRAASTVLFILYMVDTCVLCSGCTAQWIVNLTGIDIGTSSGALDRSVHVATGGDILQIPRFSWVILVYVFHYIMYTLSGFLVTFLTVERLFAVSQPLKYNTANNNQYRNCQLIVSFFILAFLIYLPILIYEHTTFYWNPRSGNLDMIGLYPRVASTVALFACAAITIPTNIAILYYLRKAKKLCDKMTKLSENTYDDDEVQVSCTGNLFSAFDVKMTVILLGISFAFLLFTIPNRLLVVVILLIEVTIPDLFVAFTWNICHINFAINSLFYFFVSQECREELKNAFRGEGKTEASKANTFP